MTLQTLSTQNIDMIIVADCAFDGGALYQESLRLLEPLAEFNSSNFWVKAAWHSPMCMRTTQRQYSGAWRRIVPAVIISGRKIRLRVVLASQADGKESTRLRAISDFSGEF